jgi:hypothetical protein
MLVTQRHVRYRDRSQRRFSALNVGFCPMSGICHHLTLQLAKPFAPAGEEIE